MAPRTPSPAVLMRQLDAARKREAALREERRALKAQLSDAWQRTAEGQREHVEGYAHRRAIEGAARKHGATLDGLCELLAARLVVVDVGPDGSRLTLASARGLVARWSAEGPRVAKGAAMQAA